MTSQRTANRRIRHTAEAITCPAFGELDNRHLAGYCEDCDMKTLSLLSRGQAEEHYQAGRVGQDQFEAYMFVWAAFSPSRSGGAWGVLPTDTTVRRIARKLIRTRALGMPAELLDEVARD